jgi:hypothetical protein
MQMTDTNTFDHLKDDERDALANAVKSRIKFFEDTATISDSEIHTLSRLRKMVQFLEPQLIEVRKDDLAWLLSDSGTNARITGWPSPVRERAERLLNAAGVAPNHG